MQKEIIRLILESKYEQAYTRMDNMTLEEKWKFVGDELFNEEPKTVYTFLLYLVAKDNNEAEWQFNCFLYLVYYNPFFDDTMKLASWHIKRALELNSNNLEYKKQVISILFSYPEQNLSNEEFLKYANDVLDYEPANQKAREIINKLKE